MTGRNPYQKEINQMEYLKAKSPCNLFLIGTEKGYMSMLAADIAAAWLKTEPDSLCSHPDYKRIEAEPGAIQAEQISDIQTLSYYIPLTHKAVCIVENAETITVPFQNKLLKVLEDGTDTLAVVFISEKPLIDTLMSRCISITFRRASLEELKAAIDKGRAASTAALLSCDGSMERYNRIVKDAAYLQYLEGFYETFRKIPKRSQLKYVLKLTNALKEKDPQYLPERLEEWQMRGFLCLVGQIFWHLMLSGYNITVPTWLTLGNLPSLYRQNEIIAIYQKAELCLERLNKKGNFTKNDFFEFLMELIPLD